MAVLEIKNIYAGAIFTAKKVKISTFLNYLIREKNYNHVMTSLHCGAFSCHLTFVRWIMNNVDAEFEANRALIATATSNLVHTWKKPMMP